MLQMLTYVCRYQILMYKINCITVFDYVLRVYFEHVVCADVGLSYVQIYVRVVY